MGQVIRIDLRQHKVAAKTQRDMDKVKKAIAYKRKKALKPLWALRDVLLAVSLVVLLVLSQANVLGR